MAALAGTATGSPPRDQHLARLDKAATLAAKLAEQHAQEAEQARVRDLMTRGGVDAWIAQALQITDLPQSYAPGVKKIIMAESGGNPRAINTWDSNARRGTPSQGLMQTIPSTYRHYVHPEVADRPITDPVANITAGVRYMIDNYGAGTLAGRRPQQRAAADTSGTDSPDGQSSTQLPLGLLFCQLVGVYVADTVDSATANSAVISTIGDHGGTRRQPMSETPHTHEHSHGDTTHVHTHVEHDHAHIEHEHEHSHDGVAHEHEHVHAEDLQDAHEHAH